MHRLAYRLGLEDLHEINSYETDFLYQEIFIDRVYDQFSIAITDGDVVLDIGCNIGLFAIYAAQKGAHVFSLEPVKDVFMVAKKNLVNFKNIKLFNVGLSDKAGMAQLTFYPNYSLMSGSSEQSTSERMEILYSSLVQSLGDKKNNAKVKPHIDKMVQSKLGEQRTIKCKMNTLANFIDTQKIHKVDLLKIDIEGPELKIIQNIDLKTWSKIRQLIVEVHSKSSQFEIYEILKRYFSNVELKSSVPSMLYAWD